MENRKTKEFQELLDEYESMTLSQRNNSCFFWRMLAAAETFSDWTVIYQYGDDSLRKDAQRNMQEKVFKGSSASEVQLNIFELFLVLDKADRECILKKYIYHYHSEDDFIFVLCYVDWYDDTLRDYVNFMMEEYQVKYFEDEEEKTANKLKELQALSTFNP